jgi:hypothetical protein
MTDPDSDPPKRPTTAVVLLLTGALLAGILLRLHVYLDLRSLWQDEAMLALNILERTPAELLKPLDMNQAAPPGFLMAIKLCVVVFGKSEYALRAVPLACGLLLLPTAYFGTVPLTRRGALVVAWMMAVNPTLIYFSNEVKQYSSDALATALLLALSIRAFSPGNRARVPGAVIIRAAIIGAALLPWFSHPSIFLIVALGTTMIVFSVPAGDRRMRRAGMTVLVAGLLSFSIEYFLVIRFQVRDPFLVNYWSSAFPPVREGAGALLKWGASTLRSFIEQLVGSSSRIIAAAVVVAAIAGLVRIWRCQRWLAVLMAMVVAEVLSAAAIHVYPVAGRLMLFLLPVGAIAVASGIIGLGSWFPGHRNALVGAASALLVVLPVPTLVSDLRAPERRQKENIRAVLNYVNQSKSAADRIYVYWLAVPAFQYYADHTSLCKFGSGITHGTTVKGDHESYKRDLRKLADQGGRVWLVFTHIRKPPDSEQDEFDYLTGIADELGTMIDKFEAGPAMLWEDKSERRPATVVLYDFGST